MRPAAACAVRRSFSYIRLLPSDGKSLVRNPYPARLSAHSRFPVLRIHPVWRPHTAHLFTRSHILPLRKTSYPPTCSARLSARSRFPVLRATSRPPPASSAAFRISLFPHFTEHIPSADCTRLSFSPIRIFYPTKTTHPPTVSGAFDNAFTFSRSIRRRFIRRPCTAHRFAHSCFPVRRKAARPPPASGASFRAFACPVLWEAYPPYPPRPFFHTAPAASYTETLKPAAVC